MDVEVIRTNLEDILMLLQKYFIECLVSVNNEQWDLLIKANINNNLKEQNFTICYNKADKTVHITAKTPIDIVYSFYFFMSEVLGFVYLHPEELIIPAFNSEIFNNDFTVEANSLFASRGFHLHTLHPIEMTHFLFDFSEEHKKYIKNYITHLVRLGQNTVQFYLLERTDLSVFIPYITEIIEYAHSKGVSVGVMLSLYRIQQYSYRLLKLSQLFNINEFVRRHIDAILEAPFDYIVIETPLGEFLPDLMRLLPATVKKIEEYITYKKNIPLYYSKHIVKKDHIVMEPADKTKKQKTSKANFLFRTVMCFSLFDDPLGAYENEDFSFVYREMKAYRDKRGVNFWPTIAYWVSFDNSVPLFLFPYFRARFIDVQLCKELHINGHILFSSGFEWGGFLIELAAAGYTWEIKKNGEVLYGEPLSFLQRLLTDKGLLDVIENIYNCTNEYLMRERLLPHITGEDPFIDFPVFNHIFQPRPTFTIKYIRHKIRANELKDFIKLMRSLKDYAKSLSDELTVFEHILSQKKINDKGFEYKLCNEMYNYIVVLHLRILHKINIYYAAVYGRLKKQKRLPFKSKRYLVRAKRCRLKALTIIGKVTENFRYKKAYIYGQGANKTSYEFSYFYPASVLFFWEREEKKLLHNRFNPFFMKLWNFLKILGLK